VIMRRTSASGFRPHSVQQHKLAERSLVQVRILRRPIHVNEVQGAKIVPGSPSDFETHDMRGSLFLFIQSYILSHSL
jgi:hypothetical protein